LMKNVFLLQFKGFGPNLVKRILLLGLVFLLLGVAKADDDDAPTPNEDQPAPKASPSLPTLYLRVGERYPLDGIQAQKAYGSPPQIASIHEKSQGLMLVGQSVGEAKLTLINDDKKLTAKIVVRNAAGNTATGAPPPLKDELAEILKLPGLHFSRLGEKT